MLEPYPERAAERDKWILARRPSRNPVDAHRPSGFFTETERTEAGEVVPVSTVFLTGRECPWRCLMCDLWKHTLAQSTPAGAIPAQIDFALQQLPPARQVKLYNAGSFFDPRAVPPEDHPAIADQLRRFEHTVVECHPNLVGASAVRFRDQLEGSLEVAMGLETAHADVLHRLNKRMTLGQFSRAADFLRRHSIALRAFVLVKPPFLDEAQALHWGERSIDFAFDCGATAVSLIPTRLGNGALEVLAERGEFSPPKLSLMEQMLDYGVRLGKGRVFVDLWDLEKFSQCANCFAHRRERIQEINLTQIIRPTVPCSRCGGR